MVEVEYWHHYGMCYLSITYHVGNGNDILRRVQDNTNKKTLPSMKVFMADVTNCRFESIYGTNGDPPTGTLQMGSDEDKAF